MSHYKEKSTGKIFVNYQKIENATILAPASKNGIPIGNDHGLRAVTKEVLESEYEKHKFILPEDVSTNRLVARFLRKINFELSNYGLEETATNTFQEASGMVFEDIFESVAKLRSEDDVEDFVKSVIGNNDDYYYDEDAMSTLAHFYYELKVALLEILTIKDESNKETQQ